MTGLKPISLLMTLLLTGLGVRAADLSLVTGDVDLVISSATAGSQPDAVTDETSQLQWTTEVLDPVKKITVQTNAANPAYALTVRATNVSAADGTAAGEVTLSTTAADLITGIPAGVPLADPGSCNLRYSATASAAGGTGADIHTITFTITDQ